MNALTFTARQQTPQRVDMSPLVCQLLKGMSVADIAAIKLQNGKRKVRVDELFENQALIRKISRLKTAMLNWILLLKSWMAVT